MALSLPEARIPRATPPSPAHQAAAGSYACAAASLPEHVACTATSWRVSMGQGQDSHGCTLLAVPETLRYVTNSSAWLCLVSLTSDPAHPSGTQR